MPPKGLGYEQAKASMAPHGAWPTKRVYCDALRDEPGLGSWIALPVAVGPKDATRGQVMASAFSLGELVRQVTAPQQVAYQAPEVGDLFPVRESPLSRVDVAPGSTNGKAPESSAAQDVAAALARLVASQAAPLDRAAVEEIASEVVDEALTAAGGGSLRELVEESVRKLVEPARAIVDVRLPSGDVAKGEASDHESMPVLLRELALGNSVLVSGPAGSGKTTGVEQAAARLGRELVIQPAVGDRFELLGFVDAAGHYQASPIYRWATTPGALLLLDEIDRCNPSALCALHAALANGSAVFPCGQVKIDPSNMVAATANTWGLAADADYVGSARLDAATLNRFSSRILWGYDSALETRLAGKAAVDVAGKVRAWIDSTKTRIVWSPRDTMALGKRLAMGLALAEALAVSVLACLKDADRKTVLARVGA